MHSATLQHQDRIDTTPAYAELVTATNFSFLRGASHPFEMVGQAAGLGLAGLGVCDRNSLAAVVRAYAAARDNKAENPDFKLVGAPDWSFKTARRTSSSTLQIAMPIRCGSNRFWWLRDHFANVLNGWEEDCPVLGPPLR